MKHLNGIMVDIETLGTAVGSVILSIGAVRFDVESKTIHDEFYVNIDPEPQKAAGMLIDKSTVQWWKGQPKAAAFLKHDQRHPAEALQSFIDYVRKDTDEKIWCWGAAFDIPMIEKAINIILQDKAPWKYRNVMCTRTIANMFQAGISRADGTHHNALDDARNQAKFLIDLVNQ